MWRCYNEPPYLLGRFTFLYNISLHDRLKEGDRTLWTWLQEIEEFVELSKLDWEHDKGRNLDIRDFCTIRVWVPTLRLQ